MQRDSLAAIGQSLRQDFDALINEDLFAFRDLARDVERLSAALGADMASLIAWLTSTAVDLELYDERMVSDGADDAPRQHREEVSTSDRSPPHPTLSPMTASAEQMPIRASDSAFRQVNSPPAAQALNFTERQRDSAGLSSVLYASRADRAAGDIRGASPSASATADAASDNPARTVTLNTTSEAPSGFSKVKNLSDLARRIESEARRANPAQGDEPVDNGNAPHTTSMTLPLSNAPSLADVPALFEQDRAQADHQLEEGSGGRAEQSMREELARLIGARPPAAGSAITPPLLPRPPQRAESPVKAEARSSNQTGESAADSGASEARMIRKSRIVDAEPEEVDMETLLEALARSLREDYKRYYGV